MTTMRGRSSAAPLLARYAELVVRRPWTVVLLALLATLAVAQGMRRLIVELDPEKQLPADNRYVVIDQRIRREFGGKNFVAMALVPTSGTVWRREILQAVYDLTFDMILAPGVIPQNVLSLSSPYVRVPAEHDGVLTADYLMKEVPADDGGVAALRARYEAEPLFKGALVSEDERAALVLADFFDGTDPLIIVAAIEDAVAKYRTPDLAIAVTGEPIFRGAEAALVRQQGRYFMATVLGILVILFFAFGQLQGVVLPSVTAVLSTVWAIGVMGLAGIPMNGWTTAAPVVVVTVAAGHSAQMLKRYYEEFRRLGDQAAAVVESTAKVGGVMLAAGATAAGGFAALSVLRIPALTQFGLAVASGIAAAVLLEMTFMLGLRALWPTGSATTGEGPLSRWLGVILAPLGTAVARHPRGTLAAFLAVALIAAAGYPRLTSEFDTHRYWSERTPVGRDLHVFDEHFPATTTLNVLLEGARGTMETPAALALMASLQRTMEADPSVGRTASAADIILRTYAAFAPGVATGLPRDTALAAQLFYLSSSPALEGYVDRSRSRAVVRGFLTRRDSGTTRRVLERIDRSLAERPEDGIRVWVAGGVGPRIMAINDHAVTGKVLNIIILFAVILVIGSVLLQTVPGGLYVILPLAMALIVDFGLFAWLGVAFDLSGASILAVGVGIGADYAIYFLYRLREEYRRSRDIDVALRTTMDTSGRAVLFVALAISAGFGVYLLSDYYPLIVCGIFVPATMLVSCLATLTLLPAVVLLRRPRFVFEGDEETRRSVA